MTLFWSHPLHLVAGLVIWSIWFVVLYGGLSVGCAVAPPTPEQGVMTWLNVLLGVGTLAVTLLLLYCAWRCWSLAPARGNTSFVVRVAAGVHLFSAGSTLAVGLPLLAYPPCV